ncbi:MAG: YbjN domain-containing protein [Nitrospira sp.]|jgi:hypothetical protein|nr:YbjN domain-containing protein [Nitrospira sp.]
MAKMTKRISQALETIKDVLEKAELTPVPLEEELGFEAHFGDDGPEVRARARVWKEEKFVFYLEFAKRAQKKTIRSTSEFITRANWGLITGNFELDCDTGTTRFKSSVDFSGVDLTSHLVRNIVLSGIFCLETYAAALMAVMDGSKSPADAISQAEASSD